LKPGCQIAELVITVWLMMKTNGCKEEPNIQVTKRMVDGQQLGMELPLILD